MVKLGIIMFAAIMFLFCALVYMGVNMKGILIVYFVLLGSISLLAFCLLIKSKKDQQKGDSDAK